MQIFTQPSRDSHKLGHVLRGQMLTLPFRGTNEVLRRRVLQYRHMTMLIRSSYILYFAMITSVVHAAESRCDTNQNRIGEKVFDTIIALYRVASYIDRYALLSQCSHIHSYYTDTRHCLISMMLLRIAIVLLYKLKTDHAHYCVDVNYY